MAPIPRVLLVVIWTSLVCARMAAAQMERPRAGSGGLFGSGGEREPKHGMDLSVSLAELYDSDTTDALRDVDPLTLGGYSTMVTGGADYRYRGSRVQFVSSTTSVFRYYDVLREVRSQSHTVGLGLSVRLSGRTNLLINQGVAYSPSYLFGLFPRATGSLGEAIPAAPDYAVSQTQSYAYSTSVALTHHLRRRTQLRLGGDTDYTDFIHETEFRRDLKAFGVSAELARNLTRNVALSTGYRFRSGDFGYGSSSGITEHGVDVGLSAIRPLSRSRRALADVRVGVSTAALPAGQATSDNAGRRDQLLAVTATAGYEFSRSWLAQASYRRGFQYVAGFTEPVAVNGISTGLSGLLSRRVDVSFAGGYSNGGAILGPAGTSFDIYTASVRARCALSARAAIYAEYLYFFYDFGAASSLAPGIATGLQRNGIRAGLTWRLSALER